MKTIAAQYLEYAPRAAKPAQVRQRLREAFEVLPLSIILLGWNLPPRMEDAVAEECAEHHAALYRWHPLLASDAGFALPGEWQPVNLHGEPVPGFKGLPEFTFMCPNRTDVQEWIAERIEVAAQRGIYDGLFFDRMRWPSPAENPEGHLACFCKYCRRMASDSGLDLEAVRRRIEWYLNDVDRARILAQALFSPVDDPWLETFFDFRLKSITRTVKYASKLAQPHGLKVGLDCFSSTLTRMVGQSLSALDKSCDWIKLMTYPRVYGPAGLPFELNVLSKWLMDNYHVNEMEASEIINQVSGLTHSSDGLDSKSLAHEIKRGRNADLTNLFAGIALVELEGIHQLTLEQVKADLAVCENLEVDGLVLSWDLWHIPHKYLSVVGDFATE
jgi:hypothetical protein